MGRNPAPLSQWFTHVYPTIHRGVSCCIQPNWCRVLSIHSMTAGSTRYMSSLEDMGIPHQRTGADSNLPLRSWESCCFFGLPVLHASPRIHISLFVRMRGPQTWWCSFRYPFKPSYPETHPIACLGELAPCERDATNCGSPF